MIKLSDEAKDVARYLISNFWIHQDANSELYILANKHYESLQKFFVAIGMSVVRPLSPRAIIRIDKIPMIRQVNHGIPAFSKSVDYVLFCGILAYLEDTGATYFIFPSVMDEVLRYIPKEGACYPEGLDMTVRAIREAISRVFTYLVDLGIFFEKEGTSLSTYTDDALSEGLYYVQPGYQYILRNIFSTSLSRFTEPGQFIKTEQQEMLRNIGRDDPHFGKTFRTMLTTPYVRQDDLTADEWKYIDGKEPVDVERVRRTLAEIMENLDLHYERYATGAALVAREKTRYMNLFYDSDRDSMAELTLLLSKILRDKVRERTLTYNRQGSIEITMNEFLQVLNDIFDKYQLNWSKAMREGWHKDIRLATSKRGQLIHFLKEWRMIEVYQDQEIELVKIYPFIARNVGKYVKKGVAEDEQVDQI